MATDLKLTHEQAHALTCLTTVYYVRAALHWHILDRIAPLSKPSNPDNRIGVLDEINAMLFGRLTPQTRSDFEPGLNEPFEALVCTLLQELLDHRVLYLAGPCFHFVHGAEERLWAWASPGRTLPSVEPYGRALAQAVAEFLLRGGKICHSHPGYCGKALWTDGGAIVYGDADEGWLCTAGSTQWIQPEAFVHWLAEQSDHSLFGFDEGGLAGNQRINKAWLLYETRPPRREA